MPQRHHSDTVTALLEKKAEREYVLAQVTELLNSAEEKHRGDRENRRKWNRIRTRLEDSVVEVKKAIAECDMLIDIERRRFGEEVEVAQESRASEPESSMAETDPEKRAAVKIAATPIERLSSIPLQEVGFARAYAARKSFGADDSEFRQKLSTKLELASQLHGAHGTGADEAERRSQPVLREAIIKVQKGEIRSMRNDEIDLLIGCYGMLNGKLDPDPNNSRLLNIMSGMIDSLSAEKARRRAHSR